MIAIYCTKGYNKNVRMLIFLFLLQLMEAFFLIDKANLIHCRFCNNDLDRTQIKTMGDYGFCSHCHKVVPLVATGLVINADESGKFSLLKPELLKLYEFLICFFITAGSYVCIENFGLTYLTTALCLVPYMILTCSLFPYYCSSVVVNFFVYLYNLFRGNAKFDTYVFLTYMLTIAFLCMPVINFAFAELPEMIMPHVNVIAMFLKQILFLVIFCGCAIHKLIFS